MRILLADAGATKTDWVKLTLDASGEVYEDSYSGLGISPLHHDTDMMEEELRLVRADLGNSFDVIRFYGAGIGTPLLARKMETILSEIFDCYDIKADGDMAGAAVAALGDARGIACIMGTGSNSCHFNGKDIDRKSVSLGYLLDDQGGGVAFSRQLLSDVFKKIAPEDIISKFHEAFGLSVSEVVDHLYRQPSPNRWIAGFMPFITANSSHPYISDLIKYQINIFFDREFASYSEDELKNEGIGFVGSVACELSDYLSAAMHERGWKLRSIVRKPLKSLSDRMINEYSKR